MQFRNARRDTQLDFSTVIEVKTSDEFSHTLIGEPGQTSVELEYRKLEIVFKRVSNCSECSAGSSREI